MTAWDAARPQGRATAPRRQRAPRSPLQGWPQATPRALPPAGMRRFGPPERRLRRNQRSRRVGGRANHRAVGVVHTGGAGRGALRGLAALGAGLVLAALLVGAAPGVIVVGVTAMVAWPVGGWVARRNAAHLRLAVRSEAAPAVLDLLGAALLAGLNPHKAILRIAERAPDALREDLGLAAAVLRLGGTPTAALRAAADRSGLDELRAAAAALEAAERWGAPPAEALAARAEALRSRTRLQAEAEAGRAAVRLAFPLVLCFLPAFILTNVELWLQLRRLVSPLRPATVELPRGFDRQLSRASTKRDCELIEEPHLPQEDLPRRACPLREEVNLCLPLDVTLSLLGS
jgi:Flp pilus assembly protein TadB